MARKTKNPRGGKHKKKTNKRIPQWLHPNTSQIYALSKAGSLGRSTILKSVPDTTIHALCQCTHDLLKKKLNLSSDHCRRLKPHKGKILKLLEPGKSVKERRNILQRGGFVGTLAAAIISAIPAIASLFKK